MTTLTDVPNSPRPTSRARSGWDANPVTRWMRANLFPSIGSTITTLILTVVLGKALLNLVAWGILNAVWTVPTSDTTACRAARILTTSNGGRRWRFWPSSRCLSSRAAAASGARSWC
jgi:general L-amino acid transport system permease protein